MNEEVALHILEHYGTALKERNPAILPDFGEDGIYVYDGNLVATGDDNVQQRWLDIVEKWTGGRDIKYFSVEFDNVEQISPDACVAICISATGPYLRSNDTVFEGTITVRRGNDYRIKEFNEVWKKRR